MSCLVQHGSCLVFNGISECGRADAVLFLCVATNAYVYRISSTSVPRGPLGHLCPCVASRAGSVSENSCGPYGSATPPHSSPLSEFSFVADSFIGLLCPREASGWMTVVVFTQGAPFLWLCRPLRKVHILNCFHVPYIVT